MSRGITGSAVGSKKIRFALILRFQNSRTEPGSASVRPYCSERAGAEPRVWVVMGRNINRFQNALSRAGCWGNIPNSPCARLSSNHLVPFGCFVREERRKQNFWQSRRKQILVLSISVRVLSDTKVCTCPEYFLSLVCITALEIHWIDAVFRKHTVEFLF